MILNDLCYIIREVLVGGALEMRQDIRQSKSSVAHRDKRYQELTTEVNRYLAMEDTEGMLPGDPPETCAITRIGNADMRINMLNHHGYTAHRLFLSTGDARFKTLCESAGYTPRFWHRITGPPEQDGLSFLDD